MAQTPPKQPPTTKTFLYDQYYLAQPFIPEDQQESFLAAITTPLPTAYRLNATDPAFALASARHEEIVAALPPALKPTSFPFYPTAFQFATQRKDVRKCPDYQQLRQFLILLNETGQITRQELVSMVPVLLLAPPVGATVLDVCAAPGSKTSQLIEAVGPTGCVFANDADKQRAYLLSHQTLRISSPQVAIATNYAQDLPFTSTFDAVLCDVPCSGDGTVRKNPTVRPRFTIANAYSLHAEQLAILLVSIAAAKPGARIVYSTCSMNPIEDEAVVQAALLHCNGAVRLVDARPLLPGLKATTGLARWTVYDHTFAPVVAPTCNIPATAFPAPDNEALHLEYTLRLLPHLMDSGGFYVALLEKVAETPALPAHQPKAIAVKRPATRKRGMAPLDEQIMQRFIETPEGPQVVDRLRAFYALRDDFPVDQLYVANTDASTVFFVSEKVAAVIDRQKVMSGGVRMFKRHKGDADAFRLVSDGVQVLSPYIGDARRLAVSFALFVRMLQDDLPLAEFGAAAEKLNEPGCVLVEVVDGVLKGCCYSAWRGRSTLALLIPKQDVHALAFLLKLGRTKLSRTDQAHDESQDAVTKETKR